MPEGPEIRLAADEISAVLVNLNICRVSFAHQHLKKFEKQLSGRIIKDIKTKGKAILTYFDNDLVIYSHNQLYGRWYVTKAGQIPNINRQLRLSIETKQHAALLYSASDIDVLPVTSLKKHTFLSKLGPDILSDQPSENELIERFNDKTYRQRQLASLLLDQHFLAGLGNYLRAEILFFAHLNPKRKPAECSHAELKKLAKQIITITARTYRTHGITNPPKLVKRLILEGKKRKPEHRFSVYSRNGQPCYYCGHTILRANIGGRPMYSCATCQQ